MFRLAIPELWQMSNFEECTITTALNEKQTHMAKLSPILPRPPSRARLSTWRNGRFSATCRLRSLADFGKNRVVSALAEISGQESPKHTKFRMANQLDIICERRCGKCFAVF
jgi:hypothetical protein